MASIDPFSILSLVSMTVILGYIGSWIFERTKISDVIWLLVFGLLIGPIFSLIDVELFIGMSPLMIALALMIILFDAGLHMDIYQFIMGIPRSSLLAILNVIFAMVSVGCVSILAFGVEPVKGLALGAAIGGTGSAVVLTIIAGLKIRSDIKTLLGLESIISSPICIVLAITLLQLTVSPTASAISALQNVFSNFSIAFLWGFVIGIIWMFVLHYLKGRPFDYMLTLAMVLLIYVVIESLGGNGAIASLAFGLALGNATAISKMLKLKTKFTIGKETMKKFHGEITFFIKSFFFVFMGIVTSIELSFIFWGIVIACILIVSRLIAVHLATLKMGMSRKELKLIRIMAPRGEGAAVLSQLPRAYGIPGAEIFSNVAFVVILATILYTTITIKVFHQK